MLRQVPSHWIEPNGVMAVLGSAEPVVALDGPRGSGKSAALAAWSRDRDDAVWLTDGEVPQISAGLLLVDDARQLSTGTWNRLRALLDSNPGLVVRVATTSRSLLPPDLEVHVFGDLYLDRSAIAAMLRAAGSHADSAVVESITHGHPSSVRRIALSKATTLRAMADVLAAAACYVEAIPPALAVPAHLTAELVTELGTDPAIIDDVERRGLGRWTGEPDAPVFQLLPALRYGVRATGAIDRQQRLTIRTVAANILYRHHAVMESLTEAVSAQRLDLAERAILAGGLSLLTRHSRRIEVLLRGIPMRQLASHHIVAATLALVLHDQPERRHTAQEILRAAASGLAGLSSTVLSRNRSVQRALLKFVEGSIMRVLGLGDGGVSAARRAAVMLDRLPPDEKDDLGATARLAHTNIAMTLMMAGELDEARGRAVMGLDVKHGSAEELLATGVLAMTDVLAGRMVKAERTLSHTCDTNWAPDILGSHAGDLRRIAQAWTAVERDDLATAYRYLDTLWTAIETIEHWALILHVRALADIASGRAEESLERFRTIRSIRSGTPITRQHDRHLCEVTESLLHLALGQPHHARAALRSGSEHPKSALAAARAALVQGHEGHALNLLSTCDAVYPIDVVTADTLKAVILARSGREQQARTVAASAMTAARVHGLRTPLLLVPAEPHLFDQSGVVGVLAPHHPTPVLTPRERLILDQLRDHKSAAQIAAALHVSVNTIKTQRRMIYRKLGVSTRKDAVMQALALNLFDSEGTTQIVVAPPPTRRSGRS